MRHLSLLVCGVIIIVAALHEISVCAELDRKADPHDSNFSLAEQSKAVGTIMALQSVDLHQRQSWVRDQDPREIVLVDAYIHSILDHGPLPEGMQSMLFESLWQRMRPHESDAAKDNADIQRYIDSIATSTVDVIMNYVMRDESSFSFAMRAGSGVSIMFHAQSKEIEEQNYHDLIRIMTFDIDVNLRRHVFELLLGFVDRHDSTFRQFLHDPDLLIAYKCASFLTEDRHKDAYALYVYYSWQLYESREGIPKALGFRSYAPPFDVLKDIRANAPRIFTRNAQLQWLEDNMDIAGEDKTDSKSSDRVRESN